MTDEVDRFWRDSLASARAAAWEPRLRTVDARLTAVDVAEVEFAGWAAEPIRGWFRRPHFADGPLPVVVRFTGYGAGRGAATDDLVWAAAGYAELVMDTRGQGDGGTADGDHVGAGFLTRGIESPETYYYRRAFVDAALAVSAARSLPGVDASRIATLGNSQGGGLAIAAAVLDGAVNLVLAQSPFLADVPGALRAGATGPWVELLELQRREPRAAEWIAETLPFFDVVTLARRATTPIALSCGLADDIVPPATTFALHDAWAAERSIRAWPGAGHESGGARDVECALRLLREHLGAKPGAPAPAGLECPL